MGTWDVLLGSIFAVVGALIFLHAISFPNLKGGYPGPGLFPQLLGVLLVFAGLGIAIQATAKRVLPRALPLSDFSRREKITAALIVLAIVGYIVFVDTVGFIPITIVIMLGMMLRTGVSWGWSIVVSVGVTVAIYILFNRILHVPLPGGVLKGWL